MGGEDTRIETAVAVVVKMLQVGAAVGASTLVGVRVDGFRHGYVQHGTPGQIHGCALPSSEVARGFVALLSRMRR